MLKAVSSKDVLSYSATNVRKWGIIREYWAPKDLIRSTNPSDIVFYSIRYTGREYIKVIAQVKFYIY